MAKSNIALIITDLDVGGAERCLVELATRLDRAQFRPVVYSLAPAPPAGGDSLVKSLETAGIDLHFLDGRRNWQFFPIVHRLERLLRQQNAQLTQTFLFHANIVGRIAARRAGGGEGCLRHSRRPAWQSMATVARSEDRFPGRSPRLRQSGRFAVLRRSGWIAEGEIGRHPERRGLVRFERPKREESGHGVVTYVGRLDRQKGLSWLLDTATVWLRELPDCELLIVGEGPERGPLEAKCRSLGLSDRVHFALWRLDIPQIGFKPAARAAVPLGRDAECRA